MRKLKISLGLNLVLLTVILTMFFAPQTIAGASWVDYRNLVHPEAKYKQDLYIEGNYVGTLYFFEGDSSYNTRIFIGKDGVAKETYSVIPSGKTSRGE